MNKRLVRIACAVMMMCMLLATGAMAAEPAPDLNIRVNGILVAFPDAQPYVDSAGRTMVPVRFASEQLGAAVSWDDGRKTASISKGDKQVEITIGSPDLMVRDGMSTRTITMDTVAVIKEDRTYTPIRFVAEALGAYVDYSDTYRTVGIYSDVLTPDQILNLQSLPYTQQVAAIGYDEAKVQFDTDDLAFYYGTDRSSFTVFANAREHLYHIEKPMDTGVFYKVMVESAVNAISYNSAHMIVRFLADSSCIYQSDSMDRLTCTVRGIAEVQLNVSPMELTGKETAYLCKLGFSQLSVGTMYIPVDVHMNTTTGNEGTLHTIVPAGTAY